MKNKAEGLFISGSSFSKCDGQ